MILRIVIRRLKRLVLTMQAYEYHRLANRTCDQLRMHSDRNLKDLGLTRASIRSAAHHKCPKCHEDVWNKWTEDA